MQIVLSGNSPGELWGWIRPLVLKLRDHLPEASISLFLFPCPYATGKEVEVARNELRIENVFSPAESVKSILFGNGTVSALSANPILVHLGGDLMYASLLARRLRARAYAYQWGQKLWDRPMAGYFVTDAKQKELLLGRGIPQEKVKVVGDLVVDAIQSDALESQKMRSPLPGEFLVTFFPGSRKVEITHLLPLFLRVAEITREKISNVKFALAVSPFVSLDDVAEAARSKKLVMESSFGVLVGTDDGRVIETDRGARITVKQGSQYQLMQQSDCILTIPGTKSGEAGFLGRPIIVVLPTNQLDLIPYPGLIDLFGKVPVAGQAMKRLIGSQILKRHGFVAQPNILAGESVVPEIVDRLTPEMVSSALIDLLLDAPRRASMSARLKKLYQGREPGAENLIHSIFGAPA